MIKIENNDLDNILIDYKVALYNWLYLGEKYKNNTWKDRFKSKIDGNKNHYQKILSFVYYNLDRVITSKPNELDKIIFDFEKKFKSDIEKYKSAKGYKKDSTAFGKFKATMESYYNQFFSSEFIIENGSKIAHGNWLTSKLSVNVCPYCNRQYTFTISADKTTTRPQFDHFKPKSIYPYLALSFYNLVPSCPNCNHIKREKELDIHPYEKGFGDDYKFKLITQNDEAVEKGNYKIKLCDLNGDANRNINTLGLNSLYEGHRDYVDEILDKAEAYNLAYYNSLINSYKGLGKQASEIDRFVWGGYLEEAEHCKRPLSKLTRDILDQLEIK